MNQAGRSAEGALSLKYREFQRLAAILLLAATPCFTQTRGSTIVGLVQDSSGAPVPNATVSVQDTNARLRLEFQTSASGTYIAANLPLGTYKVTVAAKGFRSDTADDVELSAEREARLTHTLALESQSSSATVTASARTVDASLSGLTNQIAGAIIREQPLNGRDYLQLATLQPGVTYARAKSRSVNTGYGSQLSIAGSRPVQNNFRLDGISISDNTGSSIGSANGLNLGVDALREFSILTNGFTAEYGRASGGVVNAVTRSGDNQIHGGLSYFHRNDNFDARNFFDPRNQPEFRRHQYAAQAGGAIRPNRTFFFAAFEALHQLRGNTTTNTTISDAARSGQTVRIDPAISTLLKFFPRPNLSSSGDTGIYTFTNPTQASEYFLTSRLDHRLSDRNSIFARYSFDKGRRQELTAFGLGRALTRTRQQSAVLEQSLILSPAIVNSLRLGLSRTVVANNLVEAVDSSLDDPALVFVPGARSIGRLDVVGLTLFPGGTGSLDYDSNAFTSIQLYDDMSVVRGKHWLKFGGSLERTRFNSDSQSLNAGEYRFPTVRDFLENRSDRLRALLPGSDTVRGIRQWIFAWYFQDRIQLTRRFTLQLGVRHEWITTPTEVNGKLSNLDTLLSSAMRTTGPLFYNPSFKNFAPRGGFAWDVFGAGRTLVRGGYGIYYDQLLSQFLLIAGFRNSPSYLSASIQSVATGRYPLAGYNELVNRPSIDFRAERLPRNPDQPYVQQWNFNLEQDLSALGNVRLAYAGSHGLHLSLLIEDANLAPATTLADGRLFFPANGVRANPNFAIIRDRRFEAQSSYHSLQFGWEKRTAKGTRYSTSYVFAKSIDDDSASFAQSESENSIGIPIIGNSRFNRGLSNHDQRHSFVATFTQEFGTPRSRWLRPILGGWRLSSISTVASGSPFTVTLAYDAARTLTLRPDRRGGQRPNLNPGFTGSVVTGNPLQWYNPAAFLRPDAGYLGNLGRNTFTGPGLFSIDSMLAKRFSLGPDRRVKLDFRFEAFNALNRANFDLPVADRLQVFTRTAVREDAGRVTTASPGREIQLGLKVQF